MVSLEDIKKIKTKYAETGKFGTRDQSKIFTLLLDNKYTERTVKTYKSVLNARPTKLIPFLDALLTRKRDITKKQVKSFSNILKTKIEKTKKNSHRFKNVAEIIDLEPPNKVKDVKIFKNGMAQEIKKEIAKYFKDNGSLKVSLVLSVNFKFAGDEEEYSPEKPALFHSASTAKYTSLPILNENDILKAYDKMFDRIEQLVEDFTNLGSGFVISSIPKISIKMSNYKPFHGASYIDLPAWIKNKKCCINVKNTDNKCFMWAVLSALHPVKKDAERVSKYKNYVDELNFEKINFPVDSSSYATFEELNKIPLNIWGLNKNKTDKILEYGHSINNEKDPINLLRFEDDEKSHFVWIKKLNAFQRDGSVKTFNCEKCLQHFTKKTAFENHFKKNQCINATDGIIRELPEQGKHITEFKNFDKMLESPFVVYADCESLLIPIKKRMNSNSDFKETDANAYQYHKCFNVGFKLVSKYPQILEDEYRQFDGENAMDEFLKHILQMSTYIKYEILKENKTIKMSDEEKKNFKLATHCMLCKNELGSDRVKYHDHLTGKYRGACHNKCNVEFNYKRWKLPVIFHNLKNYDSNLILQKAGKFNKMISVIPNTMEKYLSFDVGECRFLDSIQFTLASLDKLVKGLNRNNDENDFKNFNEDFREMTLENRKLLRQKGIFPYDWYNNEQKLQETKLPEKECFYSSLSEEIIKDEDYEHALKVWNKCGCNTFYDYMSLYLKTDVLLLADVFEAFRKMCLNYYRLDPVHYYTAPGFSWDAMLLMTNVSIECFKEGQLDMLNMIQENMRGGISMITTRYAKANNPYMKDYNKNEDDSYIMYLDANNLYGGAMCQPLPVGKFEWNHEKWDNQKILSVPDNQEKGFIFEVDLNIPENKHDYFNDYPLLPENTLFKPSPKMEELRKYLGMNESKVNKLIPNLTNKKKYVIHYRNLKQALSLGVELIKVHRVLSFKQSPYLKEYIDFNTSKRAQCKNDFEKDLFKLFNNAIFGKTCENVNNRIDVDFINSPEKFVKQSSKHHFKNFRIFSNDLCCVEKLKTKIKYNRPMIVGFCVLELSKVFMYDFHYNYIKKNYGDDSKLLFTDTDSLTYHIKTKDIYKDMNKTDEWFDFSDYPKDHPCFSEKNKKVVLKFKDETSSKIVKEFVGLRAKMYSLLLEDGTNKKTAKGVKRNKIKNLMHDEYKSCVFGQSRGELQKRTNFNSIQSINHQLYTIHFNKVSLCSFDDKRFILNDNINTLSHGHYKIM